MKKSINLIVIISICILLSSVFYGCNDKIEEQGDIMCIIKYETNGGSEIEDMSIVQGGDFIFPTAPHKSGHKFAGWYLDNETFNESALHLMDKKLNSDHILYAKWIDEDMEVNPMVCITMINGKKSD